MECKSAPSSRANCSFLLTVAQLDYVLAFKSTKALKRELENPVPDELFNLYDKILDRIPKTGDSREIAENVLSWIFRSKRPLSPTELCQAISISDGDTELLAEDVTPLDVIINVCGSLVHHETISNTVVFSHQQVEQYLVERYFKRPSVYLLSDLDITKTCLTYMMFDVFETGICEDEISYRQRLRDHELARYAATYWSKHARSHGEGLDEIQDRLLKLFGSPRKIDAVLQLSFADQNLSWSNIRPGLVHWLRDNTWEHFVAHYDLSSVLQACLDSQLDDNESSAARESDDQQCSVWAGLRFEASINDGGLTAFHFAARDGHVNTILQLLRANIDINLTTKVGRTALMMASEFGYLDVVVHLLKRGADVSIKTKGHSPDDDFTALHYAASRGHSKIVELLILANADVMSQSKTGMTALHFAAGNGHSKVVELLIRANADVMAHSMNGTMPIHSAARSGHLQIMESLVRANSDVTTVADQQGITALHIAAFRGDCDIIRFLLDAKADPSAATNTGRTPVHIAASRGHLKALDILLEANATFMTRTTLGCTPLHLTYMKGSVETAKRLIQAGANVLEPAGKGVSALSLASAHCKMVKYLVDAGADVNEVNTDGSTVLHEASREGHLETVEVLLRAKADVSIGDSSNSTALHVAAQMGHVDVVNRLLDAKADASQVNTDKWTPVHFAARYGHRDVLERLIRWRMEISESNISDMSIDMRTYVSAKAKGGATPLYMAVEFNHVDCVQLLLEAKADPNSGLENGWTPLHKAAWEGYEAITSRLLAANADVSMQDEELDTPLHKAAYQGHVNIVTQLLEAQSDLSATSNQGCTALHYASFKGRDSVVKVLLAKGANRLTQNSSTGRTALHVASEAGHTEIINLLLSPLVQDHLLIQDHRGWTALHLACHYGHTEIVDKLLHLSDQIISVQSHEGAAALHVAALHGHLEVVERLLRAGADVRMTARHGFKPVYFAALGGHVGVVRTLFEAESKQSPGIKLGVNEMRLAAELGHNPVIKVLLDENVDTMIDEVGKITALHIAAESNEPEVLKTLLATGSDPNATTRAGITPLHIAAFHCHLSIIEILLDALRVPYDIDQLRSLSSESTGAKGGTLIKLQLLQYLVGIFPADTILRYAVFCANGDHEKAMEEIEKALTVESGRNGVLNVVQPSWICCDSCGQHQLRGYLYRCTICDDFELCHSCGQNAASLHSGHNFVVIPRAGWVSGNVGTRDLVVGS